MKYIDLHHRSTERISQFIFYFLIGITFVAVSYTHLDVYKRQDRRNVRDVETM